MNGLLFTLSKILGQHGAGLQSFKFVYIPVETKPKSEQISLIENSLGKGRTTICVNLGFTFNKDIH